MGFCSIRYELCESEGEDEGVSQSPGMEGGECWMEGSEDLPHFPSMVSVDHSGTDPGGVRISPDPGDCVISEKEKWIQEE